MQGNSLSIPSQTSTTAAIARIVQNHNIRGQIIYIDLEVQCRDPRDENWKEAIFVISQDLDDSGMERCMC